MSDVTGNSDRFWDDDPGEPVEVVPRQETVWHYTNLGGLDGILRSRALWASSAAMLNDSTEMTHGIKVAEKVLQEWLGRADPRLAEREFLRSALAAAAERMLSNRVMVACASARGDDLAQWRAYSSGQGYAVGLRAEQLGTLDNSQPAVAWHLPPFGGWGRVAYTRTDQQRVVERVIGRALWRLHGGGVNEFPVQPSIYAEWWFSAAIAHMKHRGFASEREVRIVDTIGEQFAPSLGVHQSAYGLTPHIELTQPQPDADGRWGKFPNPDPDQKPNPGRLPITCIRVGPGPNQEAARRGLEVSLPRLSYAHVQVKKSKVPYR